MEFKVCASVRETLGNVAHLAVKRTDAMIKHQEVVLKKEEKMEVLNLRSWQDKFDKKLGKYSQLVAENGNTIREETPSETYRRLKKEYDSFLAD